jgi:long-chain fatty acid transport protein
MSRCLALAVVLGVSATAHAGGVSRPNGGSPRSVGMGGAFAAIADDAYCLHANPAGCAFAPLGALTALELVYAPRTYKPAEGELITEQQDSAAIAPAPVLGIIFKPGGRESSVTVGIGAWNTFGGILSWDEVDNDLDPLNDPPPQITDIEELVFELNMGAGWRINDRVAIGAGIRVGVGLFGVSAIRKPVDAEISGQGVGVGATAGLMLRPTSRVSVGLSWRSDLDVKTSGNGVLVLPPEMALDAEHVQQWPQSLSASVAFAASDAFVIAGQVDWTQWSKFESLDVHFPASPDLDARTHYELDWDDSLTVRLGAQFRASEKLVLRGGALFDQSAVPDRTIERQYLDANKFGGSLGTSVGLSRRVLLDVAADVVGGPPRTVPNNDADIPDEWPQQENLAPGEHNGQVFTLAAGLRIAL